MRKIILEVIVTDEDVDSIVDAAKKMLPTWDLKVEDIEE